MNKARRAGGSSRTSPMSRPGGPGGPSSPMGPSASSQSPPAPPTATEAKAGEAKPETEKPAAEKTPPVVAIDFEGIHDRIRRITIPDSFESGLLWSPDSKKLAFNATVDGKRGVYSIEFPDNLRPTSLTTSPGTSATWLSEGNQIVWLISGTPTSTSPGGRTSTYSFSAAQEVNRGERFRACFDQCWRTMRDRFYDNRLGNKNWDEIRRKYSDAAAASVDELQLATVVSLMLGELNGSHLGFTPMRSGGSDPDLELLLGDPSFDSLALWRDGEPDPEPTPPAPPRGPSSWRPTTAHLGLRFDPDHKGPGLKVRDVISGSPASKQASLVKAGELVLTIDGVTVDPAYDLTQILNGRLDRDLRLTVRDAKGTERQVTIRPVTYGSVTNTLYDEWVAATRKKVEEASQGKLGYLHIRAMSDPSFVKFDEDLYFAGAGKDGLIIDVRENGGGSIADHLLTALTQPVHAITLGRSGGPGYPQDRKIYATWNKPIIVLCNQNSFSNAEIFSHAVKTLKRGKLVGVPTAGGVISTGAARIMDMGMIRTPGRGWYLPDSGEDMELNGAVPDFVLWPEPGQMPKGEDIQLAKAIEVLAADVKAWKERPQPTLRKASERVK